MKKNNLNLENLTYSKSLVNSKFTKRHNLNLGFFEESFYIHDYEYFICSQLYKNYLLTKDKQYKEEWLKHKNLADDNLYENIFKQSISVNLFWLIPSFFISFMIYLFFKYFGKKRSITYGRMTKIYDSNFSSNKELIMNLDDMRKKYIKK